MAHSKIKCVDIWIFLGVGGKAKQSIIRPPTIHSGQRAHLDFANVPVGNPLFGHCVYCAHLAPCRQDQGRAAALSGKWTINIFGK